MLSSVEPDPSNITEIKFVEISSPASATGASSNLNSTSSVSLSSFVPSDTVSSNLKSLSTVKSGILKVAESDVPF